MFSGDEKVKIILKDYRGRRLFNISIPIYLSFGLGIEEAFRLGIGIITGNWWRTALGPTVSSVESFFWLKNAIFTREVILTARVFLCAKQITNTRSNSLGMDILSTFMTSEMGLCDKIFK